jgi:hypothetical protein
MFEAFAGGNKEKMKECLCGDLEGAAQVIIPYLESSAGVPAGKAEFPGGVEKK